MAELLAFPAPERKTPDADQRERALDAAGSFIVQAPAGAGKTQLLTERYLKLLAHVDEPEEILAITFTRTATGEMRGRILGELEKAQQHAPGAAEDGMRRLARAALAHSQARGWRLLEEPHRLDVVTMDALWLRLAHGQPLLSRLGGRLAPTESPGHLYAEAARRTFAQLGSGGELDADLRTLLLLRDNDLPGCRKLVARMLATREMWGRLLPLAGPSEVDWAEVRRQLEAPLQREVSTVLGGLHARFAAEPFLADELLALCRYSCAHRADGQETGLLAELTALPGGEAAFVEHWRSLEAFLMSGGKWRSRVNKANGFPTDGGKHEKAEQQRWKQRMTALLENLKEPPAGDYLLKLFCSLDSLPEPCYSEEAWQTLRAALRILRRATAELHVLFAEHDTADFPGLALAAGTVLDDATNPRGFLASERRRHLLVDEFQDTSRSQHELLGRLLREWDPGDGRTCFLVGDPMQSIYRFRDAEVRLFQQVQQRGLDCGGGRGHGCAPLVLSENFRSHAGLVEPLNDLFSKVFGSSAEVPFSPSHASRPGAASVHVHAFFSPDGKTPVRATGLDEQTEKVVELVEQYLAERRGAGKGEENFTIGILARAKHHLARIVEELRSRNIPFRAVELETLADRQEIVDLLSLLRALLHPADRIAWLSVLRAPWCGLRLADLHQLTGADDEGWKRVTVPELVEQRAHLLSDDGQLRLESTYRLLTEAAGARTDAPWAAAPAAWLEDVWRKLGAPDYLEPDERENAEAFFRLLARVAGESGGAWTVEQVKEALGELCALPDPRASEHSGVQLMTIHKSKGLGFDVVMVPSLEREARADEQPLLRVMERVAPDGQEETLAAPLGRKASTSGTYKWVSRQHAARQEAETVRLLYVACTRAREALHLLGTATEKEDGTLRPKAGSLLSTAWPALRPFFEEAQRQRGYQATLPMLAAAADASEGAEQADSDVPVSRSPARPPDQLWLRRVELERVAAGGVGTARGAQATPTEEKPAREAFERPAGSFERRARGNAIHAMLQAVSAAWARGQREVSPADLRATARAVLRRAALPPARVAHMEHELPAVVLRVCEDQTGRWLLLPHAQGEAEAKWSRADGTSLRVDRSFRAGPEPLAPGAGFLWIIDYKTGGASREGQDPEAYLAEQQALWHPQLDAYGDALRSYHGQALPLRYGLFFPELLRLRWWVPGSV